jgi:hypothetical protein
MPQRVQRQRTAGWRMPPNTTYVGRPGRWGNPFVIGQEIPEDAFSNVVAFRPREVRTLDDLQPLNIVRDAEHATILYLTWINEHPELVAAARRELAGRNLACWCGLDLPCHADSLLVLANFAEVTA